MHCVRIFEVLDLKLDGGRKRKLHCEIRKGKNCMYMKFNAGNVGRNADELFRRLQASQFVAEHGDQVCPANGIRAKKP